MIVLMLLCISATLFAAQDNNDRIGADVQTLMRHSSSNEMACQVPLQTLQMAKGAIPERIRWLLQQDDTYLVEQVSDIEFLLLRSDLEFQAHKDHTAWVREHDCGIMSRLACAIGCPLLLGAALGRYCLGEISEQAANIGFFAGLPFGLLGGNYVGNRYQPDQTEIMQQIARLKAVQEKKQKTE